MVKEDGEMTAKRAGAFGEFVNITQSRLKAQCSASVSHRGLHESEIPELKKPIRL